MKLLPREHGATVIWVSSILLVILTMPVFPPLIRLSLFLGVSAAILLFTAQLTSRLQKLIHIQRNRLFLPIVSGGFTLLTPLGYYIMFEAIPMKSLAIWLLLVTYTIVSVTLIQGKVQGLIQGVETSSTYIALLGLAIFTIESLLLSSTGLMHPAIPVSATPLLLMLIYLSRNTPETYRTSKIREIRRIGLQQTGNMMAFILILAMLSRL